MIDILVEIYGWSGAVLLLLAYALMASGVIRPTGLAYPAMNAGGALLVAVYAGFHHAWVGLGFNVVWFIIGVAGLPPQSRRRP